MDANVLKVLADDTRLGIVRVLSGGGERCLCDISSALGISDSLASHHVKRLADAGIVSTRRRGLWLHCSLETEALEEIAAQILVLGAGEAPSGEACCSGKAGD